MPLFEYFCEPCARKFETISSSAPPDSERQSVSCPECGGSKTHRLISRFAVGGQGDLRETTFHGCHDASVPHSHDGHHHYDHGHNHDHGSHGSGHGDSD